jgi:transposase-like protein
MAHCQEMSGDTSRRCQAGVADALTPIQHRAVELLAAGMKISATARRLGIDERTIYRWKKQSAFVEAIRRRCQAPVTIGMLKQLTRPAKPKKEIRRFNGKIYHTAEAYLAEFERVSPAADSWRRMQKEDAELWRRLQNGEV